MLVITRKEGETVQIGPDVWVKLLHVSGRSARIGIAAPADLKILRDNHVGYVEPGSPDSSSTSLP